MPPAIFTGFVKIKYVMGMFHGPNSETSLFQQRNQFFNECGLASLRSTDYTNYRRHMDLPVKMVPK
jgi:hypothetical protein